MVDRGWSLLSSKVEYIDLSHALTQLFWQHHVASSTFKFKMDGPDHMMLNWSSAKYTCS